MNSRLGDIIRFRDDKLFQGAVDISWFSRDRERSQAAAASFVFHGPRYHGVRQQEGYHEHKLTDTASFAYNILSQACGRGTQPFKMAVAGYGTGKSHLALALAELLHAPESVTGQAVLEGIIAADQELGQESRILLNEQSKPSLVITLNGMREFPLMSEMMQRIMEVLHADGHGSEPIENVRPRFAKAASLIEKLHQQLIEEICQEAGYSSLESLVFALKEKQDEVAYKAVAQYLEKEGLALDASQNGSLPELFQILEDNYCGPGKPYKNIVILFDEFGKYLEFAISKPYLAGSSALQELFEAVQGCSDHVCFVGFIQFELKAYLQRLNAECRNEAQRYITRYDNAEKVYLSTNLETLIANLIEKKNTNIVNQYTSIDSNRSIESIQYYLHHFFPASRNFATWKDKDLFYRVIFQGCWPLSPFALWFIYSLAAGSRFLQGRSALSLLKELFNDLIDTSVRDLPRGGIAATSLLTSSLREELLSSEKIGNQGAVTNAFESVLNRHRDRLSETSLAILKSIVIAAKLIMKADSRDDAVQGLSWLSGFSPDIIQKELHNLQFELNLIEWDDSLCCFDILGDAIPKTQFINFLHQRRLNEYDTHRQEKLFPSSIDYLTDKLTADIETNFGELHNIKTREWRFIPKKTNINFIGPMLNDALATWPKLTGHDEAKGTLIFCYASHDVALEDAMNVLRKELRSALKQYSLQYAPIFIILLHDADNQLGTILAEYDILQNLSKSEKEKFANLVSSHEESLRKHTENIVHKLIKQRYWITPLRDESSQRLSSVGRDLFEQLYKETLPFSMDGFATTHGNGPTTAYSFARRLFYNTLSFDDIQSMSTVEKNRAISLFKNDWNVFSPSGSIQKNPALLQRIFRQWDARCREGLSVSDIFLSLTQPPFGMNEMSALLLLGVYLASRYDCIHVNTGERSLLMREWAETLFSGNRKKITPRFFGTARLFLSEENTTKWSEFLDEWASCVAYHDLCDFPHRGTELKKQCPITKVEDMEQYLQLQIKSEHAGKEIEAFSILENKAEGQLEEAERKGRVDLYLYSTVNFGKLLSIIEKAPECWPLEYGPKFEQRFGQMRQKLSSIVPQWFETLAPATDTIDAIAAFRKKMEDYKGKLLSINLEEEANNLHEVTQKVCRTVEILATYRAKMRNAESWLAENRQTFSSLSFENIRKSRDVAKDYARHLSTIARNKPLEGLSKLRENLSEHQKALEAHLKKLEQRMSKALNPIFQSVADIQDLQTELSQLEQIFSGQDARDLSDLKNTLTWVLSIWKNLRDDNSLDAGLLAKRLEHFHDELEEQIEEKELGIDEITIYRIITADIDTRRQERSALWMENIFNKCGKISELSTDQATSLYTWLQSAPVYLTDKDSEVLAQLRSRLHAHLTQQKMDWLLQEFKKLSKEQQRNLLDQFRLTFEASY